MASTSSLVPPTSVESKSISLATHHALSGGQNRWASVQQYTKQPAHIAYTAGMDSVQYTVRGVPPGLDAELRREARASGKTLNAVVVETLEHAKLPASGVIHDDLDWFVGTMQDDGGELEAALEWLDTLPTESA
jgi:hypothetical protein